jgi:hypothetical protein
MNYREYERLKAEALAEYRRKLEAIETVWKLLNGTAPAAPKTGSNTGDSSIVKGSLQEAVRKAYPQVEGEFTHKDIYNQIVIANPPFAERLKDRMPSLANTLKRMADAKELILVETGSGKRPSRYRRPG